MMIDFQLARERMVREQLIGRGISDDNVLRAIGRVERHLFVREEDRARAYDDIPLPILAKQTISQPYMVGLMTELLKLKPEHRVLEVGTGSGYQAAVLAEICTTVYTVERNAELAERARILLNMLGYNNVHIRIGDGTQGWPEEAPFDAIIVTAGSPDVPESLVRELKNYGRMVIPVGSHDFQKLLLVSKRSDSYISKKICNCVFVPLVGQEGWQNNTATD